MRVALLTSGRFHLLNLAVELERLGHDVAFYSLVPPWVTRRWGLSSRSNRWLGSIVGPLWLARRAASGTRLEEPTGRALSVALDRVASRVIGRCDALIAMSGMCLHTLEAVGRRYGATRFVERGSMHIAVQKRILDAHPTADPRRPLVSDWIVERERCEYAIADYVSIPSLHVEESFVAEGFPRERLVRNPYGVSLDEFPPTPAPDAGTEVVLMTGTWSWQKGADVLVEAMRLVRALRPRAELVHVGSLAGDVPFPREPGFRHVDAVPQSELVAFYARARVFVLASRQDGLAVVLAQALACGVPVVCSRLTGGGDLRELIGETDAVTMVEPEDAPALAAAIETILARHEVAGRTRALLDERARANISWRAYGRRWHEHLRGH